MSEENISMIRLQQMIDESYRLKLLNNKLLEFIKDFHQNPSDEFIIKARDLLREIGEA